MDELITIAVPRAFIKWAARHVSCDTLDSRNPEKSRARIFTWRGKSWTGTGSVTQAESMQLVCVKIQEVIPATRITTKSSALTFLHKGISWVVTDNRVFLIPDDSSSVNIEQLSFFP